MLISIPPTEDHKKWQEEEAALVEQDRSTAGYKGGLFRGCFRLMARRPIPRAQPIRDAEDGVERCPGCTWELEDGRCESCGYPFDSDYMSDSEGMGHSDMEYGSGADMDNDILEALAEQDIAHRHLYGGDYYDDGETSEDIALDLHRPAFRHRVHYRTVQPDIDRNAPHSVAGSPPHSFLDGTDYGSEDDDDGSSLEGFVVHDDGHIDNPSPGSSGRSLQWETDEGTGPEEIQTQNLDDEPISLAGDDSDQHESGFATAQYNLEDDSDEGPVAPTSRRQRFRGSVGSHGSGNSEASRALAAVRNGRRQTTTFSQAQRSIPHRSTATGRSGGRSRGVPIAIVSDDDSPVPPQRQRRRRANQNRISSDEDSVDASSGTATLGRRSPRPGPRNQRINRPPPSQTSNGSSPIVVVSDAALSEEEGFSPPARSPSPLPTIFTQGFRDTNGEGNYTRIPPNNGPHSLPQALSTPNASSHYNLSQHNHAQRSRGSRRQSPLPPRPNRHSPSPRASISAMLPEERFRQGVRDRQAQKAEKKAERRRLKAEREQRQRAQAGPSSENSLAPRFRH